MCSVCALKCKEYDSEGTEALILAEPDNLQIVFCPRATECDKPIEIGLLGVDERSLYGKVSLKYIKK